MISSRVSGVVAGMSRYMDILQSLESVLNFVFDIAKGGLHDIYLNVSVVEIFS
jgi:hypothetical protein